MRRKKKSLIFIIVLVLLFLGIGYAYLTTTLSINGVTDVDRNSWDVYFDNIQITSGSVTGAQVIDAAEVVDDTTVEFHVNLKTPGDFYEFTVDAKNDGTIDAMIDSISKKLNNVEVTTLPAYLGYDVTYENDTEIEENHLLAAESLETFKIRVEYKSDISPTDLPSTAQSLTLSFGTNYVQADGNAKRVNHNFNQCTYDGEVVQGTTFRLGNYEYAYKQEDMYYGEYGFLNMEEDGWGVRRVASTPEGEVPICSKINDKYVVSMTNLFARTGITGVDLTSIDTSHVKDMSFMFALVSDAESISLNYFDTRNVENMSDMFVQSEFVNIDLRGFDTSKVKHMHYMFYSCRNLEYIDLSTFDTSNLETYTYPHGSDDMFRFANNITTVYARTQEDADRLNASSNKPTTFTVVVKNN